MNTPTSHRSLLVALGGPSNVARELGIYKPVPASVHWGRRGIPSRYWYDVCQIAARRQIEVTPDDLKRMPARDVCA